MTTTFASNNGQSGNIFDILVGSNDITINAFDLNIDPGTNDVEFWFRVGTATGFEDKTDGWTQHDTRPGLVSSAADTPTTWDVADLTLSANTRYGLFLTSVTGTNFNYTNGSAVGAVAAQNGDLTIFEGYGKGLPLLTGSTFAPRVWNGTIDYTVTAPVPLPGALPLMLLALASGAVLTRRRR
ncbi:MAG: hypothetical protein AAFT19_01125 [Pseudomonadota bacterium]